MKFALDEVTDQLELVDVDESLVLADSQLDYPDSGAGWRFMARDGKSGALSELVKRPCPEDSPTHDLYRVGDDVKCWIGRDYAHAGYTQAPVLVWQPPASMTVELHCEFALLVPNTAGQAHVIAWAGDQIILEQFFRFPQIVRAAIRHDIKNSERIIIKIGADKIIDNVTILYYAWIINSEADRVSETGAGKSIVRAIVDDAWQARYREIEHLSGKVDADALAIAHAPFEYEFDTKDAAGLVAQHNLERALADRQFGQPRFFGVKKKNG